MRKIVLAETGETGRVIELFARDMSVYGAFLAGIDDGPEWAGAEISGSESFTSAPAAIAGALARFVATLQVRQPGWAGVDSAKVDWPAVSEALERRLLRQFGFEGILF